MENTSTAIEIGQRCRKFRNALGLSQQGLAEKIGTTPQNISK
jgi:transcriptional regulator with XRE-family HTH domain